jgi:general secretion pathway protein A
MLRDPALISDGAAAMAALVGLWQEDYQRASGDTPCQKAASLGLSCLEEKGTWNNIRRLNRPAIIRLLGPGGRAHEALLERLGDDEVGLRFGAREIKLPLAEVDRFWLGEYLVLWRPPPLRHGVLKLGLRSEDVTWLRAQLGSALDEDLSSPDSTLFDATLAEQVRRFQQAQQLNPDGIVGSQTLLRLSSLVREAGSPAVLASQP